MKNGDMPAMPIEINGFGQYAPEVYGGLTKREMFAMAAMQGILSNPSAIDVITSSTADWVVKGSLLAADALLNGLEVNHANDQL